MKQQTCIFCGAPATLLCDGHLGYPPKNEDGQEFIDPLHPYTCDAPMCRHCAAQQGSVHICRRRRGCIHDTVDHCPACVENLPASNRRIIYSPAQAETIRAAHWMSRPTEFQKRSRLISGGGQQCLDL
nr:hypothetical protein [Pantoea cypripedii]